MEPHARRLFLRVMVQFTCPFQSGGRRGGNTLVGGAAPTVYLRSALNLIILAFLEQLGARHHLGFL